MRYTIRFTPVLPSGSITATFRIASDDPVTPTLDVQTTGTVGGISIDVPPALAFPPTVIQSVGACVAPKPFPISNTGQCGLTIKSITVSGAAGRLYAHRASVVPNHPAAGSVAVAYVSDPVSGAVTNTVRSLCGEGARTGARVLVTSGGVPLASVDKIMLKRVNSNRNKDRVDTVDVVQDAPLHSVTPAAPCEDFKFHAEYGTVSNPIQLLPGSYLVTVTTKIAGKTRSRTVAFEVATCGFNATIVVDF